MLLFLIGLLCICLIKIKFYKKDFILDNLAKNNPNQTSIRGIFAIIIFISHIKGYLINTNSILDKSAFLLVGLVGQLMVTIFFFYSGFGIMQSYKSSDDYFKSFITRRFFKTLIHFDIAVLCFLLINLVFSYNYSISTTILAFTGFTSIGNSNWFMFAIFVMYICAYLSFLFTKKNKKALPYVTTLFLIIYIFIMYFIKMPTRFYNTALTFVFGMFYSLFKDKIELYLLGSHKRYWNCLIATFFIFIIFYLLKSIFNPVQIIYNILSMIFCFLLILITYKVQLNNKILLFLGKHSFNIYILQRISMGLLTRTFLIKYNLLFCMSALCVTIILSIIFDYLCYNVDKLIFKKYRKRYQFNG